MAVSIKTYEKDIWNLNTQIALLRFAVGRLSRQPNVRAEFLKERREQICAAWDHFAKTDPEQFLGWEHFLAPAFAKKESEWLQTNLRAVVEFSEHRLNQMELIVRYALFEAVLKDVIGNILWECPTIIDNSVHKSLDRPKRRRSDEGDEDFRGRLTEKLVDSAAKLPYTPTSKTLLERETQRNRPISLCEYLKNGLDLEFGQEEFAERLQKLRGVRNKIAHRSEVSPKTLTDEFLVNARFALSEFPRRLILVAVDVYPDACTTESLAGECERPGYFIRRLLKDI